jgi:hypothetical protein
LPIKLKIMGFINAPMSNLQLELLKLYANQVSDEELLEIRRMLGLFFAKKATEEMQKVWETQQLTPADMLKWADEHNRYESSH